METMTKAGVKSATIKSDALDELLAGAATHAHKDETLPVLNAVRLWATGGRVYAAATDRYRLIEGWQEGEGELDPVIIRLSDLKRIVSLVKAPGKRMALPVTISAAGDMVSVAIGSDSLTLLSWQGTFPPFDNLFPAGDSVPLGAIQFNPAFFADYAKIAGKGAPVGVRFYGENKPIAIELGEHWRALLMPMRTR